MAPVWFDATSRVPRQGQHVRVLTHAGVDHAAYFEVSHTDDWPSGASWALENGQSSLPFHHVARWSPDPTAQPPRRPAPPPEPPPSEPPPPAEPAQPAILAEALDQIRQTETLLQVLPADQYDWAPHPHIATLRTLARRLVRIVARMGWVLELDAVEVMFEPDLPDFDTSEGLVETFRANASTVRALTAETSADDLRAPWRLERNGEVVAEMSRGHALRRFGVAPMVYHRGEAAVLLTALGLTAPHPYPEWSFREGWHPAWTQPGVTGGA